MRQAFIGAWYRGGRFAWGLLVHQPLTEQLLTQQRAARAAHDLHVATDRAQCGSEGAEAES